MQCDVCGTEVEPHHKFCMECGARLARPDDTLAPPTPAIGNDVTRRASGHYPSSAEGHPMFDPVTGQLVTVPPAPPRPSDPPEDPDATAVLPAVGEPMTSFAPPDSRDVPTHQIPTQAFPAPAPATPPAGVASRGPYYPEPAPYNAPPVPALYPDTGQLPTAYVPWEGERVAATLPGRSFRLKPLLGLALLAAAATVVGLFGDVMIISAGGPSTALRVDDLATNLGVAGLLGAIAMVIGALAWCTGYRWGAGLAAGAGAGTAGWVALTLGLAELRWEVAGAGSMTRELGYWCLAGAGGVGVLVLVLSLRRAGDDHRAGLDPWVAALGAIATVVAVIGPLIPINGADVDLNWSSPAGSDLPTVFFIARFAQLGLLLLTGVFGFLLVRRYGLGLAIGGLIPLGWLTLTAALQDATVQRVGPAFWNPGALEPTAVPDDLKPYVVTIAGVGLVAFFALVATAMALIDND